ncbi:TRAP transporter substrate-binding protein [Oceanobacillus saliphilus]|uniref:TRAP transporter substrate-binding protein n=1 Tax=Oceanobacillus saliphilus TaxID=2925834 RepID=UPI00201DFAC1|nr:TRAP transporter substrate-binding protein [Oceanobacillus saliphilus]
MKHNKLKKVLLGSFALFILFVLSACVENDSAGSAESETDTYSFKVSHVVQESHIWHLTAEKFNEELQERSDGRMSLEIYPASQLGLEQDMVQQLETGSIDFGFLTNAYMSTREESLNSWFMPFLFNNLEEAATMRDSKEAQDMLATLESQGIIGLDFAFAGNRHLLLKDGFVETPEDLSGKKMRIIGSPAVQSFWGKTAAGPTAMPLSEVYTSLQTGVIDGMDIDLDALVTEKYYENAEYLTLTNHATFPTVITMSKQTMDRLSEGDQEIVRSSLKAAVDWGVEEAIAREESNLEQLIEEGVQVQELDPSTFESIATEVHEEFSEQSDIIQSFIENAE